MNDEEEQGFRLAVPDWLSWKSLFIGWVLGLIPGLAISLL